MELCDAGSLLDLYQATQTTLDESCLKAVVACRLLSVSPNSYELFFCILIVFIGATRYNVLFYTIYGYLVFLVCFTYTARRAFIEI